jgi:hypothetical protein
LTPSSFFTLSTKLKLPTAIACDLEERAEITAPVARKLQQNCFVVAAISDVPDVTEKKMAIGAGHRLSLRACVLPSKMGY